MNRPKGGVRGWLRVVLIIVPFFVFVGISQILAMLVLGLKLTERHSSLTTFQTTVFTLCMFLATFTVVAMFRQWIDKESFRSLGFRLKNALNESVAGIVMGVLMISSGFVLLLLLHEINWVGTRPDLSGILLSVILFTAVAFNEELIFRGYILGNLMLSMNRYVALLVTSVLFSLLHMGNASFNWLSFLSILLAGLLLGLPYIFTRSLWLPIGLHFSWNYFQGTIFGFNVSGNKEYSLITQSRTADTVWNGGEFGFEGSLLAVLFLSLAIVMLWVYHYQKEKSAPIAQPVDVAAQTALNEMAEE